MKPVVVVTGASRGLGKTIYDHLNIDGHCTVIGTSRTPSVQSGLYRLDVTDSGSIDAFVTELLEKHPRVDVLINNAAVNLIGSAVGTSEIEHKQVMAVNFEGAVALSRALLPRMLEADKGKLIYIASVGDRIALPFNSAYAASKHALAAYVESLSYELLKTGVSACLVEPIALKLTKPKETLGYVEHESPRYETISHRLHQKMSADVWPSVKEETVAQKVGKLIRKKHMPLHVIVGLPGHVLMTLHKILPFKLFARLMSLWYN